MVEVKALPEGGHECGGDERLARALAHCRPRPAGAAGKIPGMNRHLLLTGFSCTGKTSLGQEAFGQVVDSDKALLEWISQSRNKHYRTVYGIFMDIGRQAALDRITEAEEALIDQWADEAAPRIISLGPG